MPTGKAQPETLESRARAAYLGLALGDALGATVEFMTPAEIRHKHGMHDRIIGGGWLRLKPGHVTDDTTMALALGEAMLESGSDFSALHAARAFDRWMAGKPVDIGNTVRHGILRFRRTGETAMPYDEQAGGNGACMRVLPVALASVGEDDALLERACLAQAHVTHHQDQSDAATLCVARMVRDAVLGADIGDLHHHCVAPLIAAHPAFAFRGRRQENPSGYIVDTLRAVLQALFEHDGFEPTLVDVVNRGGDADTTGAIAGMIAGALYGEASLPERWLRALDPAVRACCIVQAEALLRCPPMRQMPN
ncbi:MAG: ADP-ribosyl-[dinitrogen reductase] hydrolase [Pseudomonadota bacterium]